MPLNQGDGETCTIHALSNAVCKALLEDHAADLDLKECLDALKQLTKVEAYSGNNVEDFDSLHLRNIMDATTGRYEALKVRVKKERRVQEIMKSKSCVLLHESRSGDPSSVHGVYIKETIFSVEGEVSCLCINRCGCASSNTMHQRQEDRKHCLLHKCVVGSCRS